MFYKQIFIIFGVLLLILPECSKKVLKKEIPSSMAVVEQKVEKVAPTQSDGDSFIPADMDDYYKRFFMPLYFDFNKYTISRHALSALGTTGKLLMEKAELRVLIEGHCDIRGSSEYNMALGERRAKAVKDWLTAYGISGNRIEVTSFGKENPAYSNCMEESCHAKNRRIEWKVLK